MTLLTYRRIWTRAHCSWRPCFWYLEWTTPTRSSIQSGNAIESGYVWHDRDGESRLLPIEVLAWHLVFEAQGGTLQRNLRDRQPREYRVRKQAITKRCHCCRQFWRQDYKSEHIFLSRNTLLFQAYNTDMRCTLKTQSVYILRISSSSSTK